MESRFIDMEIYVCVPMEEDIICGVRAFMTKSSAQQAENEWLAAYELMQENRREDASDWGTGIVIYEYDLKP